MSLKADSKAKLPREDSRRGTLTSTPTERERRATLVAALDDVRDTANIELPVDTTHKTYTVQILGTDLSKQPGEKAFTVYRIELTLDVTSWLIYRRYSQFHNLLTELKSQFGKAVPGNFPPKQILQNLSPHSVDRRHQKLQDWLKAVLDDAKLQLHPLVQVFIQRGKEDTDFVPRQRSNQIESDIAMAGSLFKLSKGSWKQRWFVLRHGLLYKYASPKHKHPFGFYDVRDAEAGVLDLKIEGAKTKEKAGAQLHGFTVEVPEKDKTKRYIFAAESEEVMSQWISRLNTNTQSSSASSSKKEVKVFGVPLESVRDRDSNGVPLFLSALLTFLETSGALEDSELFTRPPDEEIKRQIDKGKGLDLEKVVSDAHAVAGLIIQYLHELPEAIIPSDTQECFWGVWKIKDKVKRQHMVTALAEILPTVHRNLLSKLFSFLFTASKSIKVDRLSKMFGRLVLRPHLDFDNTALNDITTELINHPGLWQVEASRDLNEEGDEGLVHAVASAAEEAEEEGEYEEVEEEAEAEPEPVKKKSKKDKHKKKDKERRDRHKKKDKKRHEEEDDEHTATTASESSKAEETPKSKKSEEKSAESEEEQTEAPQRPSGAPPSALVAKSASDEKQEPAKAPETPKKEEPVEPSKEPVKVAEPPKKEEPKPVETPKKEEPKPVETPKKEPAKAPETPKKEEPKKEEPAKAVETPKKEEPKPVETPKKEEPAKPVETPKKEEPKPVETPKKEEPAKPVETPKKEEPVKVETPKKEEPAKPVETPKKEEPAAAKPVETKPEPAMPEEPKKEPEAKPAEEPKKPETKPTEESKAEEPKPAAEAPLSPRSPRSDDTTSEDLGTPRDEPSTPRDSVFEPSAEPRLKSVQRLKPARKQAPTMTKIAVPAGAEPPARPEKAAEPAKPAPAPLTPKQQLMLDLNRVLGGGRPASIMPGRPVVK